MTKLRRNKEGQYVIDSPTSASAARQELDKALVEIQEWEAMPEFVECRERAAALREALDTWVIDTFKASEGYEDDEWKGTKVVGHRRSWDVDGLRKALPTPIYKAIIKVDIDSQKLDELVRAKKIDLKTIRRYFTEKANKPSVKWTRKKADDSDRAEDQAAALDAML